MTSLSVTDRDFDDWYRRSRPRVLATVVIAFGNIDAATDATDEAFTRAYSRWNRVGEMESPVAWTTKVALNHARRKARRSALEQRFLRNAPSDLIVAGMAGEAWSAVSQLPARQREVVVMRYVTDLPEADIAKALGISRSTVSSSLTDARRALKLSLSDPCEPARSKLASSRIHSPPPGDDTLDSRPTTTNLVSEAPSV